MADNKTKRSFLVTINALACKGCGYCQALCPKNVYEFGKEMNAAGYAVMTPARPDQCIGCLTCVMVCPDFAITVEERT